MEVRWCFGAGGTSVSSVSSVSYTEFQVKRRTCAQECVSHGSALVFRGGGVHQFSYTAFQVNSNLSIFKCEQQHKLERLFKLEQPFTLPPLPLRPVSGRRH